MAEPFGHEKLIIYQKGLRSAAVRRALLDGLSRRVAACDHLDRGAESSLVSTDQAVFYETAYKATVQSASLIDLAAADDLVEVSRVEQGRERLRRIAAILAALFKVAARD